MNNTPVSNEKNHEDHPLYVHHMTEEEAEMRSKQPPAAASSHGNTVVGEHHDAAFGD